MPPYNNNNICSDTHCDGDNDGDNNNDAKDRPNEKRRGGQKLTKTDNDNNGGGDDNNDDNDAKDSNFNGDRIKLRRSKPFYLSRQYDTIS